MPLLLIGTVAVFVITGYLGEPLHLARHRACVPRALPLVLFGIWLLVPFLFLLTGQPGNDVPFFDVLLDVIADKTIFGIFALLAIVCMILVLRHRPSR